MADLIDRGALREKIDALDELMRTRGENEDKGFLAVQVGVTLAACEVDAAPTVDAELVRRGKWLGMFRGRAKCSFCETDQEVYTFVGNVTQKYCAMCGARMDEVGE